MPWCYPCSKYWTPNSMNDDGTCPTCGDQMVEAHEHDSEAAQAARAAEEKTPWHFKLMVAALTVYLGWRIVDLFM